MNILDMYDGENEAFVMTEFQKNGGGTSFDFYFYYQLYSVIKIKYTKTIIPRKDYKWPYAIIQFRLINVIYFYARITRKRIVLNREGTKDILREFISKINDLNLDEPISNEILCEIVVNTHSSWESDFHNCFYCNTTYYYTVRRRDETERNHYSCLFNILNM